ncbi:MAG: SDR family NAD(P)-dependent oxidoreductase [Spirochaetes bacterium]|nr:SDR family NAD(P)-dependent oxidoreductase [Spirochaetota bacterium]
MKTALITGASRGIGRAATERFLAGGWAVVGTSTTGDSPVKQPMLRMYPLNLLDAGSIRDFADGIARSVGRVDVLVNNAAVSLDGDDGDGLSVDTLRKTLDVNLVGLIDLTERLLPVIGDGGHIINLSSGLGSITGSPGSFAPAYSISKAAVNMYTRKLAARLERRGVTVSSFDPGWVRTDMGGGGATRDPREPAEELFHLAAAGAETGRFWHRGKTRAW